MEIQKIYQAIGQKIWSFFPTEASSISFYAHIYENHYGYSLGEQVNSYLTNRLKATLPSNAPNYNTLPEQEQGKHSGTFNYSTSPIFIKKQGEK
ncbi:hypothetical protein [Histophilus somni]|uniref:hypothetical protein n=1 Tax=Histophilus somni TaxID=731 RepID=UPI00003974D3|nr:hypothetical protein [Histophilus somni]ACA31417.1 hypothetical protein HSM_1649 [Histophilus somni 2336]